MAIYAISDLHLSFKQKKTMDRFGENWSNHHLKIKRSWESLVKEEDLVIISGDISWAMNIDDAKPDLDYIHNLPGKKVMHSGNHDHWWSSTSNLNRMYEDIYFLKNDMYAYGDYAICGTRGWTCPNDREFTLHDNKIYLRELGRFKNSIEKAINSGFDKIIASLHFPPTNDKKEDSGFTKLINEHNIDKVIYGHLHGEKKPNKSSFEGSINGVTYSLVSCDYLEFCPKLIIP